MRGTRFAAASKAPESFRSVHTQQALGNVHVRTLPPAPLAGLTAHGLLGKPSAELPSFEAASFSRHATPRPSRPCPRTGPSKLNASALSLSPIGKTTRLSKTVSPSAFPDTPASKSSSGAAFFRAQKHMDMGTPVKSLCPFRTEGRAPATPKGSVSDAAPIRRAVCL